MRASNSVSGDCKQELARIGEASSERLEYISAEVYVIEDVRPKYVCAHGCEDTGVVVADPPPQVIPKAKVGEGLLAWILWAKYGLHLPLYRQEIMFKSLGVESREQKWPKEFLKDFRGVLQVDGYPGYNAILDREDILAAFCLAHARRKFIEAQETDEDRSRVALGFIGCLYGIERELKGRAPKVKKRVRQSRSTKILRRFKKWLDREIQVVLPKSPIGRAMQYTRGLWEGFLTYTKNGMVEIDSTIEVQTFTFQARLADCRTRTSPREGDLPSAGGVQFAEVPGVHPWHPPHTQLKVPGRPQGNEQRSGVRPGR